MMLTIAAELDYQVYMMGVQTTFLNDDVEEDVSVKMLPGYERSNKTGVRLVMNRKVSTDFDNASRTGLVRRISAFGRIEFCPLKYDQCVYIYEDEVTFMFLTLYVDDLLMFIANKRLLNPRKMQLMDRVETTDMGGVSRALGMNVVRDREKGTITIIQMDSTEDVIER